MSVRDFTPEERHALLDAVFWAAGPEGAAVDLDLSCDVRAAMGPPADWDRAWRLTAELVVKDAEARAALGALTDHPLVLAAARELEATLAGGVG